MSQDQPNGILITGATGQVGSAILSLLRQPHARIRGPVLAPPRAELDLVEPESIRAYIRRHRPRWVINPAAYTAVDQAESEPELAHAINAVAPRVLAESAGEYGATIIHFSTDYVFDGAGTRPYVETDQTNPLGVYGASKLAGEQAILSLGPDHFVLRTSWVYAATGKNFLRTILRLAHERARSGQPLKIVADQHGAPTNAEDLAALTLHILTIFREGHTQAGLYHATSTGATTWHGFATEIVTHAQRADPATPLATPIPITSADFPTPARRPTNSRLDCTRLMQSLDYSLPPWQQSLTAVMRALTPHRTTANTP